MATYRQCYQWMIIIAMPEEKIGVIAYFGYRGEETLKKESFSTGTKSKWLKFWTGGSKKDP